MLADLTYSNFLTDTLCCQLTLTHTLIYSILLVEEFYLIIVFQFSYTLFLLSKISNANFYCELDLWTLKYQLIKGVW